MRAEQVEFVTEETLPGMLARIEAKAREAGVEYEAREIGKSDEGRAVWGLRIGNGPRRVSVTAGAHADEPVGPMTAVWLAEEMAGRGGAGGAKAANGNSDPAWREMNPADYTFFICPHVNPDGAEANRAWLRDPLDPALYFRHVQREPPPRDVEFGYPRRAGRFADARGRALPAKEALRPENAAVAEFLAPHAPFVYHASLHSMGFAEGAWFLIGEKWAVRSRPLQERLVERARQLGFGLHDIDRKGEKGFTRIGPGFCTTPRHTAMREYFLREGDRETAEVFHPNSMEFVQDLGGDPLVMVSEIPLFVIGKPHEWSDPPGEETPYLQLRRELGKAKAALERGEPVRLEKLIEEFQLRRAPLRDQMTLQRAMVGEALRFLREQEPEE